MKALSTILILATIGAVASAQSPYGSTGNFEQFARKLRESALVKIEPKVDIPTQANPRMVVERYPWKRNIVTTCFWVGESASQNNPVHNYASSWDVNWSRTYGGLDTPDASRRTADFRPANFVPNGNPFYFALPYNDVTRGNHKPEARQVIPWFREAFERDGRSVLHNRWIRVRNRFGKECYAQWSDCGPFRTDHWAYVFGNEKPKPNLNKGAGLDVSPAVRDFLQISMMDVTDWQFVEWRDVPPGPWRKFGENNHWVKLGQKTNTAVVSAATGRTTVVQPKSAGASSSGPRIDLPTSN